jgi:hypothetical protein
MKKFILKLSAFACVALLVVTAFLGTSCNKDKTCHGTVTVVDTAGHPVAGAAVHLDSPPPVPPNGHTAGGDLKIDGVTDGSGIVNFELKLPAIMDITATSTTLLGMTGKGILRLDEPSKSASVTVTIK